MLLDRIRTDLPSHDSSRAHTSIKARARDLLFERITPRRLAHLVAQDPVLARRELDTLVSSILSDRMEFPEPAAALSDAARALLDDIVGFGPIEPLLSDPSVTEILVNGPDSVFFERAGVLHPSEVRFDDEAQLRMVIDRIIAPLGRRLDERTPLVNARLPEGHRVNAIIPPLSLVGPVLTVRKFREHTFSLHEMVETGSMSEDIALLLAWAVRMRRNIVVSGGTGSGKTTLLNALSIEIPHSERIVTVEDSAELRFRSHPHVVSLEARPANLEGAGAVDIRDLVVNTLRMRPDRIVVGECRGAEALDMLQAMNTGHDGSLTTLHSNSPEDAVSRLVTMVRYAAELPVETIVSQIRSAVQLIVHQDRMSDGTRRVTSVVECDGRGEPMLRRLVSYRRTGTGADGTVEGRYVWEGEPGWMDALVSQGVATRSEVDAWRCSWRS